MKRFLNCNASDFEKMNGKELVESIASSEGRVLVCETIGNLQPMLGDVSNVELAAAMGADVILLNIFDVDNPVMNGLPPVDKGNLIRKVKELTGRPVGINLEPKEQGVESSVEADSMWGNHGWPSGNAGKGEEGGRYGCRFHRSDRESGCRCHQPGHRGDAGGLPEGIR